ncbi:CDP-glucose 4,6-dehydratase [Xanthobacter sp. DSM 24535]|uniref:CDP-glucose 4,6-dehydratase n=1 Tax=Roseixanthobacter psychrophilus TaxID=3119917 RepID=UPI00372703E6
MKHLQFESVLSGTRVFITGHTGFTGSWCCLWLKSIGVEISGYSLPPETDPALFHVLGLDRTVPSTYADIQDGDAVLSVMKEVEPDLVLHLAAQPLVRRSYLKPVETFAVNALGTAHVLEAARQVKSVKGVVCVTTDKVYRNNEWEWPYRENDPLGGKDPYSASKAAAEMVIQSYAASFPHKDGAGPAIATARGGNIIGGGDWSEDRLVPDFVRAVMRNEALTLRYPDATRPWQHVLALVQGYGMLLAGLLSSEPERFARAWNLGPQDVRQVSVRQVLEAMAGHWRRPNLLYMDQPLPEAGALALDSSLARNKLDWLPAWSVEEVIKQTALWYKAFEAADCSTESGKKEVSALTLSQIEAWRRVLLARESAGLGGGLADVV